MQYRVGLGRDLHRLVEGRRFLLAGLELPSEKGEDGWSDGDVLAHAVADSLLGSLALGDIGEFFPPLEPRYQNADSMKLLAEVWKKIKDAGWKLANLDCVVICEKPKLLPYREKIRAALAEVLEADIGDIFVKGKTAEGLGDIGKGNALEAEAVCLLSAG
jgi:2-C-methyl-D-erythritol 2,4-cyclodiphosphate synthase/2-C-methyl-D-erythritol 4-phosphate cytidylyltransferase/2-C-methyl-D-erythritol 2,4-cyclodiphosphate synthase